eukprot:gene7551-8388_t
MAIALGKTQQACVIPASPNWYCSGSASCNDSGYYAFAARNSVYLVNLNDSLPVCRDVVQFRRDRVTSVCLLVQSGVADEKGEGDKRINVAIGAEEHWVKIWNEDTQKIIKEHKMHQKIMESVKERKFKYYGHTVRRGRLPRMIMEGQMEGRRGRGRPMEKWDNNLKEWSGSRMDDLRENARDKSLWRQCIKSYAKVNVIVSHNSSNITSGDDKGIIITWDYEKDASSNWMPIMSNILSMAACPHAQWLTAIGYANGHILVCDVKKQVIFQHFKSHIDEVQSVTWCPSPQYQLPRTKENTNGEGYVFASGSKDKTIKIWNTLQENYQLNLALPARTSVQKGRKKFDEMSRAKIWMALCWCKENNLISGSLSGEMLVWDLKTKDWSCITPAHNRIIFTISFDEKSRKIVTTSMDRQIMLWKLDSYENYSSIPSLGGFVYSISASVLNPSCIIYGVGDNQIRVWNTRSESRAYDTSLLWQGIKTKVTVVVCHGTKESVIGFGTDDGHTGVYNIRTGKFEVSASYHKKTVYSLSWGPSCNGNKQDGAAEGNSLFSCGGEGAVLIHSIHDLQSKARDMNTIIKKANNIKEKIPPRSDVEWKPDFTIVAVGNEDGSIEVFAAPRLHRLCSIQVHKKIINCMRWHHEFDSLHGGTGVKYSNWLASGSSDNYVCITDLTQVLDNKDSLTQPVVLKDKFRYFNAHSQRVTCLSWNPQTSGILASSSFDGSVQVWNVQTNEPVANFRDHKGRVLCVLWSFVDQDVLYSGGEDFTLRRWMISKCEFKTPPAGKKPVSQSQKLKESQSSRTKTADNSPNINMSMAPAIAPCNVAPTTNQLDSPEIQLPISSGHASVYCSSEMTDDLVFQSEEREHSSKILEKPATETVPRKVRAKDKDNKKKKSKSLFPLFSTFNHKQKTASQQECVLLAQHLVDPASISDKSNDFVPGTREHVNLGLFADKLSTFKMFNEEGSNHDKLGNLEQRLHLELWKGNLGGAFEASQKKGELNEMLVAMSPLGGYDFWQSTMYSYADRLESNGDYYSAATYFLAVNAVGEAIDMFKKHGMFKEAIAVAKIRLPSCDPVLNELYRTWADKLSSDSCFEHAAKCYLASGCYEDAINILSRKGDVSSLRTAAQVAKICGQNKMAENLITQTVDMLLTEMKFCDLRDLLQPLDSYKELIMLSMVHECFLSSIKLSEADTQLEISSNITTSGWMNGKQVSDATVCTLKELGISIRTNKSLKLVDLVNCLYYEEFQEVVSKEILKSGIPSLPRQTQLKAINSNNELKKLLLQVSKQLMHGMVHLLDGNTNDCFKCWLHAFELCYSTHQFDIVERLYIVLFPRDYVTVQEYASVGGCNGLQRTAETCSDLFGNFTAFYHNSLLYKFWWERFPLLVGVVDEYGSLRKCSESDGIETLSLDEGRDYEALGSWLLLQSHAQRLQCEIESRSFCEVGDIGQLVRFLSYLTTVLVSHLHARASQLKRMIADIDKKLMEAKIRKQLRQHIQQRAVEEQRQNSAKTTNKDRKNTPATSSCNNSNSKSSSEDPNWRSRDTEHMVQNEVGDAGLGSEVEIFGHDLDVMDEGDVLQWTEKNSLFKMEMDQMPRLVKDHPFPECIENAKILVFMLMRCIEAGNSGAESLAKDICKCCLNSCLDETDIKFFNLKNADFT